MHKKRNVHKRLILKSTLNHEKKSKTLIRRYFQNVQLTKDSWLCHGHKHEMTGSVRYLLIPVRVAAIKMTKMNK
jgi:hypothetical protein